MNQHRVVIPEREMEDGRVDGTSWPTGADWSLSLSLSLAPHTHTHVGQPPRHASISGFLTHGNWLTNTKLHVPQQKAVFQGKSVSFEFKLWAT